MLSGVLCWMYSLSFIPTIVAVLFMIPMLVDGFTQNFNRRESTNTLRITTGFLFGYGFAVFFLTTFPI